MRRRLRIDDTSDLASVLAGEAADEASHATVANQQNAHIHVPASLSHEAPKITKSIVFLSKNFVLFVPS